MSSIVKETLVLSETTCQHFNGYHQQSAAEMKLNARKMSSGFEVVPENETQ